MKNQAIKPAMRAVLDAVAEKQFADMQRNRPYYDALINNIPSGKETQLYNVGDSVVSTSTGTYKEGVQMEIIEAYEENGYFKYVCGHGKKNKKTGEYKFKHVERQKDLKKG